MKVCPYCAEPINDVVPVCPYCRSNLRGPAPAAYSGEAVAAPGFRSTLWVIVMVLGIGGFVLLAVVGVLIALLLPAVQQAREAARRTQCKNNLRQIGLALHNYHDSYNMFPPAYIANEEGEPMHSWRVLILPFIEQQPLYEAYDFTQPWDSPANQFVLQNMPPVFACPSDTTAGTVTDYAGVFGQDCMFSGPESMRIRDVIDGTTNTLFVGEVSGANIPWTKPEDIDVKMHPGLNVPGGFASDHVGGVQFLMVDGSVTFVEDSTNPQTLQNMFTKGDGNPIGDF